jgi:hypothetical protein
MEVEDRNENGIAEKKNEYRANYRCRSGMEEREEILTKKEHK